MFVAHAAPSSKTVEFFREVRARAKPMYTLDDPANIENHVGFLGVRRELVATRGQLPHHDFRVDEVLGAAEADKTDFQGRVPKQASFLSEYHAVAAGL